MSRRSALELIDDWLATGFRARHDAAPEVVGAVEAPAAPPSDRQAALDAVATEVAACTRCQLSMNRTRTVPGEGSFDPPVLFVGEGPGEAEDRTGRPFVGAAGQYLDKWIAAAGLDRGRCFIANCVKCRPPQNREPHPDELGACLPYLERQVAALAPRVIVCLGRIAAQTLLGTTTGVGALRGKVHAWKGIPLVATYHPSAVLRDQSLRAPVWEDLKRLKGLLADG
jgi:uracil-DNA glycosylase family 4